MSNILQLHVPYMNVGLDTMTYTVVPTLTNPAGAGIYNVTCQVSVPSALATGDGAGSGQGPGSGAGGGGTSGNGFGGGGQGLGFGGVGQGFGATSGYQQPSAYGSNQTFGPVVSSSLSIVVNQNGSPIYTAPVIAPTQGELQFKIPILAANSDVITVVLSSSNANDKTLQAVKSIIQIGEGM
jgi:hypothetical protein